MANNLLPILPTHPFAKNNEDPFVIKMRNESKECIINKEFALDDKYILDVEAHIVTYASGSSYIYWNIICNIPYKKNNNMDDEFNHPFNRMIIDEDDHKYDVGGIVADNVVTRSLFKGLEDIHSMNTGMASPRQYAAFIINMLTDMWD